LSGSLLPGDHPLLVGRSCLLPVVAITIRDSADKTAFIAPSRFLVPLPLRDQCGRKRPYPLRCRSKFPPLSFFHILLHSLTFRQTGELPPCGRLLSCTLYSSFLLHFTSGPVPVLTSFFSSRIPRSLGRAQFDRGANGEPPPATCFAEMTGRVLSLVMSLPAKTPRVGLQMGPRISETDVY
jgi:hypothetical protein